MYKIIYEKKAKKFFLKHKWDNIIDRFEQIVPTLMKNPCDNTLDIKVLKWYPEHHYRLRIWKYRFLYEVIDDIIIIRFFDAGSRGEVYE